MPDVIKPANELATIEPIQTLDPQMLAQRTAEKLERDSSYYKTAAAGTVFLLEKIQRPDLAPLATPENLAKNDATLELLVEYYYPGVSVDGKLLSPIKFNDWYLQGNSPEKVRLSLHGELYDKEGSRVFIVNSLNPDCSVNKELFQALKLRTE